MSDLSNVLKALRMANKRIDELEKYNLDLANESHNKSSRIEQLKARIAELTDALDHIARVANSSRTQSRRDRWICLRANCAISSSDEWKTADLPKIIENSRGRELRLRAENQELAATVERLREQLSAMAAQHQCGCGHPACNRCRDDADNREALQSTPQQNLNAIKWGVAKRAVIDFGLVTDTSLCDENDLIQLGEEYANETYPDKEGE